MKEDIKERILKNLNIPIIDFFYFLDVFKIEESKDVETACISVSLKPVLKINPEFVSKYCKTNEHLLMLVLHELYHFILGHTSLFNAHTEIDNIVFDAVINATLCSEFKDKKYTSFFEKLNPANEFPSCLLKPLNDKTPDKYRKIIKRLYEDKTVTYKELKDLFKSKFKKNYILLGKNYEFVPNNFTKAIEEKLNGNNIISDVIDSFSLPDKIDEETIQNTSFNHEKYLKVTSFISKIVKESGNNLVFNKRLAEVSSIKETFLINPKDRYFDVKNTFYQDNLLYKKSSLIKQNTTTYDNKILVYLDVSGSMDNHLRYTLPILYKLKSLDKIELYQFSTIVAPFLTSYLKRASIKSTHGTDLNVVFKDYFNNKSSYKNILLITDSEIPPIYEKYKKKIKESKLNIYAILTSKLTKELSPVLTSYLEL